MKAAIKIFLGFGLIETRRSKIAKIRVVEVIILIFHEKKYKLDVRVIACNFFVFSNFFRSNSFIFEPKKGKQNI